MEVGRREPVGFAVGHVRNAADTVLQLAGVDERHFAAYFVYEAGRDAEVGERRGVPLATAFACPFGGLGRAGDGLGALALALAVVVDVALIPSDKRRFEPGS